MRSNVLTGAHRRPAIRGFAAVAVLVAAGVVAACAPPTTPTPTTSTTTPFVPTPTVQRYDSASLEEYASKWSNPYGLGEMAVDDTRSVTDGAFSLSATPFTTAFDFNVYDHLKYLAVSNQSFPVPETGAVAFSVDITATTPGTVANRVVRGQYGPPGSYDPTLPDTYSQKVAEGQQAGVVLNMLDFCTGQLFDWFVSDHAVFALVERLPTSVTGNTSNPNCPAATEVGLDKAYTQIVKEIPILPGATHNVSISYARANGKSSVTFTLDGVDIATVDRVGVPLDKQGVSYTGTSPSLGDGEELADEIDSFQVGHGLFSLIDAFPYQFACAPPTETGPGVCDPATAEYSVSIPISQRLFGQGAAGTFSNFEVATTGA